MRPVNRVDPFGKYSGRILAETIQAIEFLKKFFRLFFSRIRNDIPVAVFVLD
jgi:uncharacterized protein (DUF3820 family)